MKILQRTTVQPAQQAHKPKLSYESLEVGENSIEIMETIKSARVFEENGFIKLDYRVNSLAKLPKGKDANRFRFSTGIAATDISFKSISNRKFETAYAHYNSLFQSLEDKEIVLFEDIAHLALSEVEINRRKTDSTRDYKNILLKFVLPYFGKMPIGDVKVKDIKAWMQEMGKLGISQNRFNKYYYVVKRVMDYASENEYTSSNIMQHLKRSSPQFSKSGVKDDGYYTKEEVEKILNDNCASCSKQERSKHGFINAFAHVAFLTGARTGEIMALKWSDINFEDGTITIERSITRSVISTTKTGTTRTVIMIKKLHEKLLEYKKSAYCEWVFPNPENQRPYTYSRTIVDHKFKPMLQRLNITYKGLYQTRHTFASLSVQSGIPMHIVKECMGHKDISTTQRFYLRFGNLNQVDVRNQLENLTA
jgi:integrase